MYNTKDIQFVGKHDFDKESAARFANFPGAVSFSVNIFKWELKSNGKEMKPGKGVLRVHGSPKNVEKVLEMAESFVKTLDAGEWGGCKNVTIK